MPELQREVTQKVTLGGHHTEVVFVDGRVIKLIPGKLAPLTMEEATGLAEAMQQYRVVLMEVGVPVPEIYCTQVARSEESGQVAIIMECENAGQDLRGEIVLPAMALQTVQSILGLIHGLLRHTTNPTSHDLLVGIDPKPANFCRDEKGVINFVDLMPPRFKDKRGRLWSEHPEPQTSTGQRVAYWRNFEQCGVLIVLLLHLCRRHPGLRSQFVASILNEARALGIEQEFHHHAALDFTQLNRDAKLTAIDQLREPMDVFRGRNIACALLEETDNQFAREQLDVVFHDTLFRDGFSQTQVDRLKLQLVHLVYGTPLR